MSTVEAWTEEYKKRGIPSSFRQEASGVVRYFTDFLLTKGIISGRAIDIGAGRGRNSFFLAERGFAVSSVEFIPSNVSFINKSAEELQADVYATCGNVTDPWPFDTQSFDVAIDTFCYKHQTDKSLQRVYREELFRTLKPRGFFMISLAADDDGYYGPLLLTSPDPMNKVIVDPVANVRSILSKINSR
jgi:SAM-dependent methyltransferase